jgi:hypothetical protein
LIREEDAFARKVGMSHLRQRMHDVRRHALLSNREEAQAAFGLRTPQGITGHFDGPEAVGFRSGLRRLRPRHW